MGQMALVWFNGASEARREALGNELAPLPEGHKTNKDPQQKEKRKEGAAELFAFMSCGAKSAHNHVIGERPVIV